MRSSANAAPPSDRAVGTAHASGAPLGRSCHCCSVGSQVGALYCAGFEACSRRKRTEEGKSSARQRRGAEDVAPARRSEQAEESEAEVEQQRDAEPAGAATPASAAAEAGPSRQARKRRSPFEQQDARAQADGDGMPGWLLSACRRSQEEARLKRQRRPPSSQAARSSQQQVAVYPVDDVRHDNGGLVWPWRLQQRKGLDGGTGCAVDSAAAEPPAAASAGAMAQQCEEEKAPPAIQPDDSEEAQSLRAACVELATPGTPSSDGEGQSGAAHTAAGPAAWRMWTASMWHQFKRGVRDR